MPLANPRSLSTLTLGALFSGLPISVAYSQIVTADLVVNLDAADYDQTTGTWAQRVPG